MMPEQLSILTVTPWFPNRPGERHGNFVFDSVNSLLQEGVDVSVLVVRPLDTQYTCNVRAQLFVARAGNELAAGVFIMRCGESIHYFWGATNRKFNRQRPGEAVQWAVIEWALKEGCTLYDLEGVDPVNNPGVYSFKKKMGGDEVLLTGKSYKGVSLKGKLISIFAPYLI